MPKELSKCREWEKERRNRLNEAFALLCKLLPCYDPAVNTSKIDILKNAASYIEELQTKVKDLITENKEESANKIKGEEYRKLHDRVKRLLSKNEQLCKLLREAKITIPSECIFFKKFRAPPSMCWSNRILPEQAKLLQRKEIEKENDASGNSASRKFPKKKQNKVGQSTPKHRKAILNRSDRKIRPPKKKKVKPLTPSKCVIVLSQPSVTQPCYVITNAPSNNVLGGSSTVITNSTLVANPLVSSKPTKTLTAVPQLGPGTLILANGTMVSVLPQQPVLPLPSQIITRPPLILLQNKPDNVNNSVTSAISSEMSKIVTTSGIKTLSRIRPKYCLTKTTQVNKVPIPALTSRYSNLEVVLKKVEQKVVKRKPLEKKAVKEDEKKETVTEKRKATIEISNLSKKQKIMVEVTTTEKTQEDDSILKKVAEVEVEVPTTSVEKERGNAPVTVEQKKDESSNNKTEEKKTDDAVELNINHSELSNDIFASLQVPSGCQNPESASPTAAFLLAFPLVSSLTGVKVTEVPEEENADSQRGTPTLLQIGTMDNTKPTQSESLTPSLLNLDNLSFFSSKDISGFYNSFENTINNSRNSVVVSGANSEVNKQQNEIAYERQPPKPQNQQEKQIQQRNDIFQHQAKAHQLQQQNQLKQSNTQLSQSGESNHQLQQSSQHVQQSPQQIQQPNQQLQQPSQQMQQPNQQIQKPNLQIQQPVQQVQQTNQQLQQPSQQMQQTNQQVQKPNLQIQQPAQQVQQPNQQIQQVSQKIHQPNQQIQQTSQQIQQPNHQLQQPNHQLQKPGQQPSSQQIQQPGIQVQQTNQQLQHQQSNQQIQQPPSKHQLQPSSQQLQLPSQQLQQSNQQFKQLPQTNQQLQQPSQHHHQQQSKPLQTTMQQQSIQQSQQNHQQPIQNLQSQSAQQHQPHKQQPMKQPLQSIQQHEKNPCFDNQNTIPSFGTNLLNYQPKQNAAPNIDTKLVTNNYHTQKSFCNSFETSKISTTCTYANVIKNYPEPLYTNSSSYAYNNSSEFNFNQNYYKDITKTDNRNYYSLNYENYADYRKNESNPYFSTSNYYTNYSKDKFNTNNQKNKNTTTQVRPTINWMTTPDNRLQTPDYVLPQFTKESDFYPTNSFTTTQTTYPMYSNEVPGTNQDTRKGLDLALVPPMNTYQSNEMENNQFSWSPTKIPQFLDAPSFVSSTLPTLVGDLALGNPLTFDQKNEKCTKKESRRPKNCEGQGNFLSVSQLVDHNKEVPARTTTRRNSGNRSSGKKVPQKNTQRKEKDNYKIDNTAKMNSNKVGYSSTEVFCDTNKNRNVKNSYSAEALIGQMQSSGNEKNRQNYPTNKPISVSSFLHDNIIPYFPTVDLPQDNTYMQPNQNFQTSFTHNFPSTFQNNTYTANTFIPSTNTISTSYNFMHDVTHDYSDNLNLFPMNKEKIAVKNGNKNVKEQQCLTTPKKNKRKHTNELPGFVDFPFLSMPGSINSPILPDDFHAHTGFLQPPNPQLYPCKNPFTKPNDLASASLLPLPPVPVTRNIQHPEISPGINSAGTSLTNFNLSTIFPEINNKSALSDPFSETRGKEQPRNFTSAVQVTFNEKPTFSFSYINCTSSTSQTYNNL